MFRLSHLVLLLLLASSVSFAAAPNGRDLDRIGRRIWKSECDGTVDGLTSWNSGEEFASLGIGHFIWYPEGYRGPFEESFPALIDYFKKHRVKGLPDWLLKAKYCPWPNREAFLAEHNGARQRQLRDLLSRTLREQTSFIIQRLHNAQPKYKKAVPRAERSRINRNMTLLSETAAGNYAMIDYINFKGDGLNPQERYRGQGWGLLQVLEEMQADDVESAPRAFSVAASHVLKRRVENSPPQRGERRWLEGWRSRCAAYGRRF